MTNADGNDPQPTPTQPTPSPSSQYTGYRLLMVSVRSDKYLLGNTTVHPVDEVLPGVGTRFSDTSAVHRYVRRELAGLSCCYAVEIVDDDGQTVMRGVRSGFNGTGNTWIWRDIHPGDAPAPA